MTTPIAPAPSLDDILAAEDDRFATVKLKLMMHVPFWASVLMQTRLSPKCDLPTYGATDCVDVIYYNPILTRTLTLNQMTFLLLHELGHIVFEHGPRRNGREPEKWNHAIDYFTNLMALDVRSDISNSKPVVQKIEGILHDEVYRGLSSEEIYDKLPLNPPCSQGGPGTNQTPGVDSHLPPENPQNVEERITEKVLKAHAHWEANGQRGTIPDGVLRRVNELRASKIPWQRIVRQVAVQCMGHEDYSYAPPHRRRLIRDELCYPSLRGEQAGSLVAMLDTSGSVPVEALQQALSAMPVLADLTDDLLFLSHDAAVQDVVPSNRIGSFIKTLKTGKGGAHGNGGTDHRPAFEWLKNHKKEPDLCLVFTDLGTAFPEVPPPYPVLWCVWPQHASTKVPFGKIVVIHPED